MNLLVSVKNCSLVFFSSQVVGALQQQQPPLQPAVPPGSLETHPIDLSSPVPPSDPMVRKQVVQDLMAQMQGPYNFMQVRWNSWETKVGSTLRSAVLNAFPLRTPCWSMMDSPLTRLLCQRSLWSPLRTWKLHRWFVLQVSCSWLWLKTASLDFR